MENKALIFFFFPPPQKFVLILDPYMVDPVFLSKFFHSEILSKFFKESFWVNFMCISLF